ncbi:hypothetical protein MRX96_017670 [Rhipicephalus microplus]
MLSLWLLLYRTTIEVKDTSTTFITKNATPDAGYRRQRLAPKETKARIDGLQKGKKYKFRVKAVNKEGESEPLETGEDIVAKNPYDEPGKPSKPEIVDYDNTKVDLKWDKPENDGGRPILQYIVEKKEKHSSDWVEALKTPGDKCEATVDGLKENSVMQFRVRAVNKAGVGEPSEPTENHIVKHRNLKPRIDRTNLKNVILKVGRSHTYEVDIIVKALRKQSGKYTITATNRNGKDSVSIDITILGKPAKPEGPLEVKDVHKEGCKLKWNKPKDDGGCPLHHYEEYLFRVVAVNDEGESEPLETLQGTVAKNPYDEPSKPGTPELVDWDNTSVDLKWEPPKSDGGAPIEKYIIEKKERFGTDWEKAAEVPGSKTEAKVAPLKEKTELQFRVVAVNKAGPSEPSEPTQMHTVKHRKLKPYIDRTNLDVKMIKKGKQLRLDVDIPW